MRKPREPGTVDRGHVIRLDPTVKQANAMARAAGVSRFTYNWALAEWKRQYEAGKRPSGPALGKQFNQIKREQFPWVMESPRDANSQPFADLGRAFSNFFASLSGKRRGKSVGYPQFRRRRVDDSFYVANDKFECRQRGKRGVVRLPVIGDVRMCEAFRWRGKVLSGRVYRQADRWYLAVACEVDARVPHVHRSPIVGVDLGLKTAVVPSHGPSVDAPKPLRASLRRLRRANRRLHRRKKGGANRNKARVQVARLHQRVACIRKDFWHKVTTDLVRENQAIVVEDLSMSFMLRNRRLARAASDVGLGMFRPMLQYKAPAYGGEVLVADRYYPSTQRCSGCVNIKSGDGKISLGESEYACDRCGAVMDRDVNASLNLEQYPRLAGNWSRETRTPTETVAPTRRTRVRRASVVADVGTKPEDALVLTN